MVTPIASSDHLADNAAGQAMQRGVGGCFESRTAMAGMGSFGMWQQ